MSATVTEAVQQAGWLASYALDRLSSDPRHFNAGVRPHLIAASTQLRAVVKLLDPTHDQIAAS